MPEHKQRSTVVTVAALGGGALVLWLLWRGRGKGSGGRAAMVVVHIRSGDHLELDGVSADLATIVDRARAAGRVRVIAAGDARQGSVDGVIRALTDAGVALDRTSP